MFGLIVFIVFGLVTVIGVLGLVFGGRSSDGRSVRGGAAIVTAIGVIVVGLTCITTVDARAVAVQTAFGRYQDTLGPGVQVVAPWSEAEEWTTRVQTSHFAGNGEQEERDNYHTESCVQVKLYAEQPACVDTTVEWAITEASIKNLWGDHKDFESARLNYVNTEIRARVADAFEGYDPLLKLRDPKADPKRGTYEQFASLTFDNLRPRFGSRGVEVRAVRVTNIDYPDQVDKLLSEAGVAVARTRLAEQEVLTAQQHAAAAAARNNPRQVRPGCEALIRDLAAANQLQHLPDAWQCPGGPAPLTIVGRR